MRISIHAPRTGSDIKEGFSLFNHQVFQSTLPARGATAQARKMRLFLCNFNPRSPHGERPDGAERISRRKAISIHAPRTGSDQRAPGCTTRRSISIHAPRTGSDPVRLRLPARDWYFNPRSPHGERPGCLMRTTSRKSNFNPRSPHGERLRRLMSYTQSSVFQSTLPARGATEKSRICTAYSIISIHAPRTGSDAAAQGVDLLRLEFQSTLPARGATSTRLSRSNGHCISIHAPRTGSDSATLDAAKRTCYFNPRSPHGERPIDKSPALAERNFNPRSPHGERLVSLSIT